MKEDQMNTQENDLTPLLNVISDINHNQVKTLIFSGKFNQAILLHRKEISQLINKLIANPIKGKITVL